MENNIRPFPTLRERQIQTDGALALESTTPRSQLRLLPDGTTTATIIDFQTAKKDTSVTKTDIDAAITEARDRMLDEETSEKKSKQTYSLALDRAAYKALSQYKVTAPEAYEEAKTALDSYTEHQLVTMLGERFHTNLSSYTSRIIDGEIYSEHVDEPMLRMFERGRDYRRLHGSNDTEREDAEIVGFTAIQAELCDPDTAIGTMMVSISPPGKEGSIYSHNFYDVFTLKEEKGRRYIETRRYSSALSYEEYTMKASSLDSRYSPFSIPTDAEFLARPISVDPHVTSLSSPDALHDYFHKDHDAMPLEDFQEIVRLVTMLRVSFIASLTEDPDNAALHGKIFNALLNKADMLAEAIKEENADTLTLTEMRMSLSEDIAMYGALPVRPVDTGCGLLEGAEVGGADGAINTAWSVSDFGEVGSDRYGKLTFKCPHCRHENKRPYNQLIRYCQNKACEKDVSC